MSVEKIEKNISKLMAFVDAYDEWLELFLRDGREDLEDDGLLELAVERLDAARKALVLYDLRERLW
jgi:hypothetical protein